MYLIAFEYFPTTSATKIGNSGDSYPETMLVAHVFSQNDFKVLPTLLKSWAFDQISDSVSISDSIVISESVKLPFVLNLDYGNKTFTFSLEAPYNLYLDNSVLSVFSMGGTSSGGSVDLEALDQKFDLIHNHISGLQSSLVESNTSNTTNIINAIGHTDRSISSGFQSVENRFVNLNSSLSNINLSSIEGFIAPLSSKIDSLGKYNLLDLDGQYGSYRKGTKVLIEGKVEEYEVLSSSLIWSSYAGALVISYNLKNLKGEICPCTHPFLSLAPVPATTPTSSQGS